MHRAVSIIQDIPKQIAKRRRLSQDKIDGVHVEVNGPDADAADPSNLSKLNLVTSDYPVGNGQGPEIQGNKYAAARPALSKSLASIYDENAWNSGGILRRKQTPGVGVLQPWSGPELNLFGVTPFGVGRALRNMATSASVPGWISQDPWLKTTYGAGLGGMAAAGLQGAYNFLNPEDARSVSGPAGIGAALGALLGFGRR